MIAVTFCVLGLWGLAAVIGGVLFIHRTIQDILHRDQHVRDWAPYRCDICTFDYPLTAMHFDSDGVARCDHCEQDRFKVDL